jgi:glycosyltransferase involved in cell wall biosynthesis
MIQGHKVVVVLPAYNAASTLETTYRAIPPGAADEILLVDDASVDETLAVAMRLGLRVITHYRNTGYGGDQKTCYREALKAGAQIIVMIHPDYQYTPKLIPAMASMIASGEYDVVLGSRILTGTARAGGMPLYKYIANRCLTAFQNLVLGAKLSEFHTGFRAFTNTVLESLPLEENSNDFVFDNQIIAQALAFGYRIGEISCPTRYFREASSINFVTSVRYGFGVLRTSFEFLAWRMNVWTPRYLRATGRRLDLLGKEAASTDAAARGGQEP